MSGSRGISRECQLTAGQRIPANRVLNAHTGCGRTGSQSDGTSNVAGAWPAVELVGARVEESAVRRQHRLEEQDEGSRPGGCRASGDQHHLSDLGPVHQGPLHCARCCGVCVCVCVCRALCVRAFALLR
eukprot:3418185-Rhodomonas_salina.6